MNGVDDSEGRAAPGVDNDAASDESPTMMDNIFRPITDEAGVAVDDDAPVDVHVAENPSPEPVWSRKWFIGAVAALVGLAAGAGVWGASLDNTTEQEPPPLVATPDVSEPENPEVTVTRTVRETIDTTATATERVETTATETTRVRVTATETWEISSTATETVEVTAPPAPTVVVTVTETVVRQNSQGLRREAAISACAIAVEERLTSENPEAEVNVPAGEALVTALRNDLDSWFIKLGAQLDGAEQIVDCYVSGSDGSPSVDSVLVR